MLSENSNKTTNVLHRHVQTWHLAFKIPYEGSRNAYFLQLTFTRHVDLPLKTGTGPQAAGVFLLIGKVICTLLKSKFHYLSLS